MIKNLLIIGAGQYGLVAKEVAESMGEFKKIGFLDDNNRVAIGKIDNFEKYLCEYSYAFIAMGNNNLRLTLMERFKEAGYKIAILISPCAYISSSAKLDEGTIVEPMAVVQANVNISKGCLVCSGAIIKHNAVVGAGCYLDCNCVVQSNAVIPEKTKLNANCSLN